MDTEGKFCGFIWFVCPKIIINIKKRSLIEKNIEKATVKKEKDNDNSDDEEMKEKKQENDDEEEVI